MFIHNYYCIAPRTSETKTERTDMIAPVIGSGLECDYCLSVHELTVVDGVITSAGHMLTK